MRHWIGPHLVCDGDNRDHLRRLRAALFRLALLDPPYNKSIAYGEHYDDDLPDGQYLADMAEMLAAVHRVLTADGSAFLFCDVYYLADLILSAKAVGFHLNTVIPWHYPFGVHLTTRLTPSWTPVVWLNKDPGRFVFNRDAVKVPSMRELKYNDRRAKPGGRTPANVWALDPAAYEGQLYRPDGDCWHVPRLCGTHKERVPGLPTQLPLALVRRILAMSSDPGDAVLDPYLGSGTTLVAAHQLGRRGVGIELSPDTADTAARRLEAEMAEAG